MLIPLLLTFEELRIIFNSNSFLNTVDLRLIVLYFFKQKLV